jgi:hypothetical protein
MNGLPYYKAYPRDFIEGTVGMSFELKAAYRLVLDLVYMQGGDLPDNSRYIAGLLGCSVRKWNGFRDELLSLGKIRVSGEFLTAQILQDWRKEAAKSETRPAIPLSILQQVTEHHGDVCFYCGCETGPFEIDHVKPWSSGGQHTFENLVVSCRPCNRSKGAKSLDEWEGRVQ